jgi:hypothetical protein
MYSNGLLPEPVIETLEHNFKKKYNKWEVNQGYPGNYTYLSFFLMDLKSPEMYSQEVIV